MGRDGRRCASRRAAGLALLALLVLATFALQAPAQTTASVKAQPMAAAAPVPVVIGVLAELTGAGAAYGRDLVRGAEMAVREINAEGGVQGRPLKLMVEDGGTHPARSAIAMRRLVTSEVALVVGGWGSAQVLANLEVAEQAGMPYIVVGATHPAITSARNRWTFRVIQTDAAQAEALAGATTGALRGRRVAILSEASAYGAGSRDAFVAGLQRRDAAPVRLETYNSGDRDFGAALARIRDAQPDVLALFGTLPAAPLVMQQARALGITARFVGTGGLANDALPAAAGPAAEGTVLTGLFHEDSDAQAKAWAQAYRAQHASDSEPARAQLAAWEYRALRFIAAPCLQRVTPEDRVALRDCLAAWRGPMFGVQGEARFDAQRQLVQPVVMLQLRGGRFEPWKGGAP